MDTEKTKTKLELVWERYKNDVSVKKAGPKEALIEEKCFALVQDSDFRSDIKKIHSRFGGDIPDRELGRLLHKYKIYPTLSNWLKRFIASEKDEVDLRLSYRQILVTFDIFKNIKDIELFELTTQEKKWILETFYRLIDKMENGSYLISGKQRGRVPEKYRAAESELKMLLNKSKNKIRRASQTKLTKNVEKVTLEHSPELAYKNLKAGNNFRQLRRRQKLRAEKLIGKKPKK